MPTVARILELAPTCCYLASNYKDKQALFGGKAKSTNNQATLIYIYWKILNEIYERDNDYAGLQAPANYLWELCQKFAFKAANIVDGGGGGQIAPITPGGALPTPYYFLVDATSFVATGETTVTMPTSWTGYNLAFSRGGVVQTTVDTEPSYFSYDVDTREFICTPAAVEGELFALIPV